MKLITNCSFNMGGSIVEKYPVQIRLFGEVTDKDGRKKVCCVIQELRNNKQTKKHHINSYLSCRRID
jgi:hypothetical protein